MKELSLNVLDIVQNSVKAQAKRVTIQISEQSAQDLTRIEILDDGCGMDEEFLKRVTDPFTTTRTTRKMGMGIPLLKLAAEMAGGALHIESKPGVGTRLEATFQRSHIDMPPIGDMAATLGILLQGNPEIDFVYSREHNENSFEFNTMEARDMLGDVSLNEPDVLEWVIQYVRDGEDELLQIETGNGD